MMKIDLVFCRTTVAAAVLLGVLLAFSGCQKKSASSEDQAPGVAAAQASVDAAEQAVEEAKRSGNATQQAAAEEALRAAQASLAAAKSPNAIPGGSPAPNEAAPATATGGASGATPSGASSLAGSSAKPNAPLTPAAPPPPPAPVKITVPSGTVLAVRTTTQLSTKTVQTGDAFAGSLTRALVVDGETLAPRGSEVEGVVATSDPGGRVKGVAYLAVRLQSIKLADGRRVNITTDSFETAAKTTKKKDAAKVGIGAGIGAAIGAIAGGGKGAAIGAGVGGGAGAGTVLATRGDPAVIPAEAIIDFRLAAPFTVEVQR